MTKRLNTVEGVHRRIAAGAPELNRTVSAKLATADSGEDKEYIRKVWNAKYVSLDEQHVIDHQIHFFFHFLCFYVEHTISYLERELCDCMHFVQFFVFVFLDRKYFESVPDLFSFVFCFLCVFFRYVNRIQELETEQVYLKDAVWSLLRDGREYVHLMQDHKMFIDSMSDEVRTVKEQIDERRNWHLAMALKFKRMGMRFIDRAATANAFRCVCMKRKIVMHCIIHSIKVESLVDGI